MDLVALIALAVAGLVVGARESIADRRGSFVRSSWRVAGESALHEKGTIMGITDKVSGRAKQATGAITGSKATERQGKQEERKADKKEEAAEAQTAAEEKQAEADRLERKT